MSPLLSPLHPDALLRPRRPFFVLVALISAAALTAALVGQYGFDLAPCILCLYERLPYAAAGLTGLALALLPTSPRLRRLGMVLIGLAFATNTGLGLYHVGVELHWWASPACTGGAMTELSLTDLQAALTQPVRPACDDVQWSLFGITLAGYNLILSLGLLLLTGIAARRPA